MRLFWDDSLSVLWQVHAGCCSACFLSPVLVRPPLCGVGESCVVCRWLNGSAIAKELLGRTMPNGRVSVIESRYRHLSLANQGAFGLEIEGDPWTLVSWGICGREHVILERNGVVRDVLVAPAEAAQSKSVIVSCSVDGVQAMKTAVVFSPADGWRAPSMVSRVWLIDDQEVRFVERSGAGIRCTELGA